MKHYANYQAYRNAWQNAFVVDPPIPLNLDIELATICNLQCPFCFTTDPRFKNKTKTALMSTDLALRLIDEAAEIGIPALKFNWRGESTLHQDFTPILKYASNKKSFFEIILNTNGNIPDHAFEGLLYTTKVIVSLDAFGKDLYAKMRKRGDIRTVMTTVNKLIEAGHKNIWVRRVLTPDNKNEAFVSIVKAAWGDKVNIAEHFCFDRGEQKTHQINRRVNQRTYCGYPSQRLLVTTDGKFYPCCVDTYETMPLVRYPDKSIQEVWESEKLVNLRKDLREHNFKNGLEQCKYCTSFMAYDAYERQFIQDRSIK